MTTYAPPPKFAPTIWRDQSAIYLQLATDKQVLKFPLSEAGLHKALKLIPPIHEQPGYLSGGQNISDKFVKTPKISDSTIRRRRAKHITEDQRKSAADIIRRRFKNV